MAKKRTKSEPIIIGAIRARDEYYRKMVIKEIEKSLSPYSHLIDDYRRRIASLIKQRSYIKDKESDVAKRLHTKESMCRTFLAELEREYESGYRKPSEDKIRDFVMRWGQEGVYDIVFDEALRKLLDDQKPELIR